MLFWPSFSSLILQYFLLIFTIKVYLCFDKLLDSWFGFQNQFPELSIDFTLSLVDCTSRAFSLFNQTFINMLKTLCSWLGWSPSVQISSALVCSPSQRLLLYMYLSQRMSTFTNYLKVYRSLDGYFIQWPRRTSDRAITHLFPYTLVSQK